MTTCSQITYTFNRTTGSQSFSRNNIKQRSTAPRQAVQVAPCAVYNLHTTRAFAKGSGISLRSKCSVQPKGPKNFGRRSLRVRAEGEYEDKKEFVQNTEFGYSRKDVLLIGAGLLVAGFGGYAGLERAGFSNVAAGNVILIVITLGGMIAWTASYIGRVATKDMTYVKQLKAYEDAVMAKRLEEMPETELEALLEDVERENEDKKVKTSDRL